jgi:inosine-uridine nucleoside N-ribohydrolase
VTAAAEFNIYCDAEAARQVFQSPVTKTLIPLDISSQVVLGYDLLSHLSAELAPGDRLLRAILPGMYHTYRQRLGLEGIFVHEVVGLMAVMLPDLFTTEPLYCDVETGDCLTHGATVIDRRRRPAGMPNMDVVVDLDAPAIVKAIRSRLKKL